MQSILITGNMGYIGPIVAEHLRREHPGARLTGFDSGFFAANLLDSRVLPECVLDAQYFGDVRNIPQSVLDGVDAVVHLAAISNDPMGNAYERVTADINHCGTLAVARAARAAGVKRFVFASSCSVYGFAEDGARNERSAVNPLTAYARSKVASENHLATLANDDFVVTSLRFATACGASPRLRLDLVLNDFVAGAIASRSIRILSDGTPWRPLIAVDDMARAIDWAIARPAANGGAALIVNAGSNEWNYQIRDLAEAVAEAIPGTDVEINIKAPPDKRSYKVDFSLFASLAPEHQPRVTLAAAIAGLKALLEIAKFSDANFRESSYMRLNMLSHLTRSGLLDEELRWMRRT
jgi:nucleoside-diphosphate-sugar epimerase